MPSLLKPLQLTLAIIKPHIVCNPIVLQDIRSMIIETQFRVVKARRLKLTRNDAENFYGEHEGKFFFNRLVTFMTSGPIETYILAHENAIQEWRNLMGPTKVFKTQFSHPSTIRGKFGLSDTRNATHGSDSVESAHREINTFFPTFNIEQWYRLDEPQFRVNNLMQEADGFVHMLNNR